MVTIKQLTDDGVQFVVDNVDSSRAPISTFHVALSWFPTSTNMLNKPTDSIVPEWHLPPGT